jgi:hypothetical protein
MCNELEQENEVLGEKPPGVFQSPSLKLCWKDIEKEINMFKVKKKKILSLLP